MATLEVSDVADNPEDIGVVDNPSVIGHTKSSLSPEIQAKHIGLITEKFAVAANERLKIHHLWNIFYRVNVWDEKRIVRSWFVGMEKEKVTIGLTKGTSKDG